MKRADRFTSSVVEASFKAARIYFIGTSRLMLLVLAFPFIVSQVATNSGTLKQRFTKAFQSFWEAWENVAKLCGGD